MFLPIGTHQYSQKLPKISLKLNDNLTDNFRSLVCYAVNKQIFVTLINKFNTFSNYFLLFSAYLEVYIATGPWKFRCFACKDCQPTGTGSNTFNAHKTVLVPIFFYDNQMVLVPVLSMPTVWYWFQSFLYQPNSSCSGIRDTSCVCSIELTMCQSNESII